MEIDDLCDVWWASLTRARLDGRVTVVPDLPGTFRNPHRDHWGRVLIAAAVPLDRLDGVLRKRVPCADALDLARYFSVVV